MIEELKEVRDALAAYNTSSTVKHPLIREHGIRALAAITAQLTKTDDNVSCPSVANTGDINADLLEALKEAWSVVSSINYGKNHVIKRSDGEVLYGQTDEWCMWALKEVLPKMEQAIARAEQKDGE